MINNVDENGIDEKDFADKLTDVCKIMADTQNRKTGSFLPHPC